MGVNYKIPRTEIILYVVNEKEYLSEQLTKELIEKNFSNHNMATFGVFLAQAKATNKTNEPVIIKVYPNNKYTATIPGFSNIQNI